MTVPTETNRTPELVTNGVETEFDFTMLIFDDTELQVWYEVTGGEYVQLVLDTNYTVLFDEDGGTVTTIGVDSPYAAGKILIIREIDLTSLTNWLNNDIHNEVQHQEDFDRRAIGLIQLSEQIDRCVKFPTYSDTTGINFPEPEADKLIGWNEAGDDLENKDVGVIMETANWEIVEADADDVVAGDAHIVGNLIVRHKTNGTKREFEA